MNPTIPSRPRRQPRARWAWVAVATLTLVLATNPSVAHATAPEDPAGAAQQPAAKLTCTARSTNGEKVPAIVVIDADPESLDIVNDALKANERTLGVEAKFTVGGRAADGFDPLESVDRLPERYAKRPLPFLVVVPNQQMKDDLNQADGVLATQDSAFVVVPQDLALGADVVFDGKVSAAGKEPLSWTEAPQLAVSPNGQGGLTIDVRGRPSRTSVPTGRVTVSVAGAEQPCQVAGLPFTIARAEGVASPPEEVKVEVTAGDEPLTASITAADWGVKGPSASDDKTPGDETEIEGDSNRTVDGTITMRNDPMPMWQKLAVVLILVAAVGGGVFLFVRRNERAAPAPAGPGPWGPGGAPPPPSPHGPSSSPSAGYAAPAPTAADLLPARATAAPEFGPLELTESPPGWTAAVPLDSSVRLADLGVMRVLPADRPSGRTWAIPVSGRLATAGWLEKKAGRGEDAEPTLRSHDAGRALIGVFDGVGGAGSATARRLRDATELSGAYVASRLARDLLESWYSRIVQDASSVSGDALADWLQGAFRDEAEFIPSSGTALKGSMSRVLPTTLAAVAYECRLQGERLVTVADALWAGDSRAYVLTPRAGLQVLTVDDTRETDALALIRNDQPLENLVSADRPFRINHRQVRIDGPAVLVAATDGCFGYLKTPAHFEYLLLDRLSAATSLEEWSEGLVDELASFTGDDASFALGSVGFAHFADLRDAFAERGARVEHDHWAPFGQTANDPGLLESYREQSWAAYQVDYHALLVPPEATG